MIFIGSISSYHRFGGRIGIPHLFSVLLPALLQRLRRRVRERLLKVGYNILNMLRTDRQPDEILSQDLVR